MKQIGDMVHYVSYGTPGGEFASECRAAVVAGIHSGTTVDLCVLNPTGIFFKEASEWADQRLGGTWHDMDECLETIP